MITLQFILYNLTFLLVIAHFLDIIASLLKKGVEVRLIHAKEPGTAWREDHEKHPILYDGMERVLCPRVHFKLIIIDTTIAYVGSANLTGAGMGMKSSRKRNFAARPLPSTSRFAPSCSLATSTDWYHPTTRRGWHH